MTAQSRCWATTDHRSRARKGEHRIYLSSVTALTQTKLLQSNQPIQDVAFGIITAVNDSDNSLFLPSDSPKVSLTP